MYFSTWIWKQGFYFWQRISTIFSNWWIIPVLVVLLLPPTTVIQPIQRFIVQHKLTYCPTTGEWQWYMNEWVTHRERWSQSGHCYSICITSHANPDAHTLALVTSVLDNQIVSAIIESRFLGFSCCILLNRYRREYTDKCVFVLWQRGHLVIC